MIIISTDVSRPTKLQDDQWKKFRHDNVPVMRNVPSRNRVRTSTKVYVCSSKKKRNTKWRNLKAFFGASLVP